MAEPKFCIVRLEPDVVHVMRPTSRLMPDSLTICGAWGLGIGISYHEVPFSQFSSGPCIDCLWVVEVGVKVSNLLVKEEIPDDLYDPET